MNVQAIQNKANAVKADLYVVPVFEGGELAGAVKEFAKGVQDAIAARVKKTEFKAKAGKTLTVQADAFDVVLIGMGEEKKAESFRRAAAKARAAGEQLRASTVAICVGGGAAAKDAIEPSIEGFLLADYKFDKYKKKKKGDKPKGPKALRVVGAGVPGGTAIKQVVKSTVSVIESVSVTRDLVNEMPSVKSPSYLAKQARAIARTGGLKCEVWQGTRLKKEKMNGILAVSAGSKEPGAFIKLVYKPKKKAKKIIAVVGKGITFDSGGLSLKPAKHMEWMKQDMAGAAVVLGLMQAVAATKPDVEVRGYVASAENMPGSGAQKPGDIITYRNGTTAEVLNTDAEGRLVLGDALCIAREEKPDAIIDLATLTGACLVALGTDIAGVMGTDQKLIDSIIDHGNDSGEPLWQLPLAEEHYGDDIKSSTADIKNIGGGYAGTITAALFLKAFVDDIPWAHMDIAGPAFAERPKPYSKRGGTGFGVRTLLSYLHSI